MGWNIDRAAWRTDPAICISVPLILLVVAGAAALVPALRATRVDPVEVLKEE